MSYTDHAAQARSYSRTASAATRKAESEAHKAQGWYLAAAQQRRLAALLTSRGPGNWYPEAGYTPAALEDEVRAFERLGDSYLRSSFSATGSAAHYRDLAASYRDMAASQAGRLAS
jgi:hypothetical protein